GRRTDRGARDHPAMAGKPGIVAGRAAAVVRRGSSALRQTGAGARRGQFRDYRSRGMTPRWRSLFAASLGAALTACAQPLPGPSTGRPAILAREDLAPGYIGFIGPKAQHAPPFLDTPGTNFYCLRSFLDRRTGAATHQLYVSDSYFGAERGWNAARDRTGAPLPFVPVSRG